MTAAAEEVAKLLGRLSDGEKAEVLQIVTSELGGAFPGIEATPGVLGGEARIIRTRISVWALEQARRLGLTEPDILRAYPALRATDLAQAWAYARAHPEQIDRDITENENG